MHAFDRLKLAVELIGDDCARKRALQSEDSETLTVMRGILARSATAEDGADYWWGEGMGHFDRVDSEWTAIVAVSAISGQDFSKRDKAVGILAGLGATSPVAVMNAVGTALLGPEPSFRWLIGSNRGIFSTLPPDVVMRWLSKVGIEGARRIARDLPSPSLVRTGRP